MINSKPEKGLRVLGAAMIITACAFSFSASADEGKLTEFQKQSRDYRQEGLRLQKEGDYESALNLLQKSIEADPGYASAYNDIGIIYESLGLPEQAEAAYLQAIKLSPELPGPYSNIALFYESQDRQVEAIDYWLKRSQTGVEDDPWRKRAQDRFNELTAQHPEIQEKYIAEESRLLIEGVAREKHSKRMEDQRRSDELYLSARKLYKNGDYQKALEEVEQSIALDPDNAEKLKFRDEVKAVMEKKEASERADREKKERQKRLTEIKNLSQSGLKSYQENNPAQAEKDFTKVLELIKVTQK